MSKNPLAVRCGALSKSTGKQCKAWAIKGGTTCRLHGGSAPQVRAKAAVRAEVMEWGLHDMIADPGEVLLRLVSQSAQRCAMYAEELQAKVDELGLEDATVGIAYGEGGQQGEYIRGLATLEAQERDRCANFSAKAVAAGLAERQVRLAE